MLRKYQPKVISLVGLMAVLAAFAISATAAATASAAIETLWCMESATGKYETLAKCEALDETGTGALKFEWEAGPLTGEAATVDFTSGPGFLFSGAGTIECLDDVGSGEVLGPNDISNLVLEFLSCNGPFGEECHSPEMAAGIILTNPLLSEFVYLKSAAKLPLGALAEPENAEKDFATIICGILQILVTGAVIGLVEEASVNKEVTTATIVFKKLTGTTKEQEWTKVEETATKWELSAAGGQAAEETTETTQLLVGGVAVTFEIMA
jgi:hypothetical protein